MAQAQQEIDFQFSGLDTDSDIRVMAPGDSDYRLNCIVDTSNDNSLGNVQNDWGMVVETYTLPPGDNKVIGSCKDTANNAVIRFLWNSLGFHQIIRWYSITNVTELILQSSVLNFQEKFRITHANVVLGILTWTDNYVNPLNQFDYNGPRKINIDKAIKFTLGLPGGYTVIDLQTINAIKYPPTKSPIQVFQTVAGQQNLLIGKYHQAYYRYVYDDKEKSVFSPIAPLLISQNEDANGNYAFAVDNQIKVTVKTGHETVTKIEIGFKINTAYYIVCVLDKAELAIASNTTYDYLYNGDRIEYALGATEVLKIQDYVPQVVACQEIILKNVLTYANFIEGYENSGTGFDASGDLNGTATPGTAGTGLSAKVLMKQGTFSAPAFASLNYGNNIKYRALSLKRTGIYRVGRVYMDEQGRCGSVNSPQVAQVQIPWWKDPGTQADYFIPPQEWINSLNQKPYIEWNINDTPPEWAYSYMIVCTKDIRDLEKTITFVQWGAALGDIDGIFQNKKTTLLVPQTAGYSFEQGDRLRLVAEYTDWSSAGVYGQLGLASPPPVAGAGFTDGVYNQRVSDTYDNAGTGVIYDFQIQKYNVQTGRVEVSGDITGLKANCTYVWEIYNPSRTTTESEFFYGVGQEFDITNPGTPTRSHSVLTGTIEGIDVYHRWKKIVWKPQRVKFKVDQIVMELPTVGPNNCSVILKVGDISSATTFQKAVSVVPSPVANNLDKAESSASTNGFKDQKYGTSLNGSWSTFNMYYVAASTAPNAGLVSDSTIINVLSGNLLSQNGAALLADFPFGSNIVPISGLATFFNGDNHAILAGGETEIEFDTWNNPDLVDTNKDFLNPEFEVFILCEDHSISDFYQSDLDSTGKGYIEDDLAVRKRYPANLRHGGRLFQETQINNLLSFDFKDYSFVSEQYNEITRLIDIGYTLKIRQRNKNNSMYVGRVEYQQAGGSVDLVASDKIFGTINPSEEFFGSYHPTGDVKSNKNTYFFDATDGQVIRDSGDNGMIAISGNKESAQDPYKMKKFFYDMAAKVRQGDFDVIGNWDEFIECYVLTFIDLIKKDGKDLSKTLLFHEPTNRWKSFMSYVPEWYENVGNTTVAFQDGKLWQLYKDPNNRGRYFGVDYPQEIAVICNIGPNTKKTFTNMDIDSNVAWDCDITIPPNSTYPLGMKSRIKKERFVSKEGKFSASFSKDMLTPGQISQEVALTNGRELRGEAMRVLMTNNERKFVFLRQTVIGITASELTT